METLSDKVSGRASLVAMGLWFRQQQIWPVIGQKVQIGQKVLRYQPTDKLLDAFIAILAGGHGLVEINQRVRPDEALQRAFGREGCAEQSTVSDTVNACTGQNVEQMRQALRTIYQQQGQARRQDYQHDWQLLDVDLTGLVAGRQGEGVTKGYFSRRRNARGRQLGRVLATWYEEVVVDRVYPGKQQLNQSLAELLEDAEQVLDLKAERRTRTVIRVDGGGGDEKSVNWLLARNYQLLTKVKNYRQARKLAQSVPEWFPDPHVVGREVGWVETPHAYCKPVRQVAGRKWDDQKQDYTYHVLTFTVPDAWLFRLAAQPWKHNPTPAEVAVAAFRAYDKRMGGLETQNKADKQDLGLHKRNKHCFAAQEMLVLLAQLAHNLIIWSRTILATADPRLRHYGILRLVRDVFHISGTARFDSAGRLQQVVLNPAHPWADAVSRAFLTHDLLLILGKT